MGFKHHIQAHFQACYKLADAKDPHRNRDVRLYLIPGEQRYVGVSDGVDAFVAPVDINPFGVDVRKLIGEYLSTGKLPGPSTPRPRVRITSTGRHVEDAQIIIMTALEQQKLLRPRIKLER